MENQNFQLINHFTLHYLCSDFILMNIQLFKMTVSLGHATWSVMEVKVIPTNWKELLGANRAPIPPPFHPCWPIKYIQQVCHQTFPVWSLQVRTLEHCAGGWWSIYMKEMCQFKLLSLSLSLNLFVCVFFFLLLLLLFKSLFQKVTILDQVWKNNLEKLWNSCFLSL